MKRINNTTDKDVSIKIEGINYTVEANSYLDINIDKHAEKWVNTHAFLAIKDINNMDTDTKVEGEVVETEEEEATDEVVDEAEEETKEVEEEAEDEEEEDDK